MYTLRTWHRLSELTPSAMQMQEFGDWSLVQPRQTRMTAFRASQISCPNKPTLESGAWSAWYVRRAGTDARFSPERDPASSRDSARILQAGNFQSLLVAHHEKRIRSGSESRRDDCCDDGGQKKDCGNQ